MWSLVDAVQSYNIPESCPDCLGKVIVSRGHLVCTRCGLVISREYVLPTFQMGAERREGDPEASQYVSLGNRLHIVDGLGSYIGYHKDRYFRDSAGHSLSGRQQKKFRRLKSVYSTRIRIGKDEAKYRALRTLNRVAKLLMLNEQVRDRAAYLFNKVLSEAENRISNNILLMAVCLLMGVREFKQEAPITLEEIAEVFEQCGHRVSVRTIVREALRLRSITGHVPRIRKPRDYVPRVLSLLVNHGEVVRKVEARGWDLSEYKSKLQKKMLFILDLVPSSKRGGRNPFIFTVSSAYAGDRLVAEENGCRSVLTQKLASVATDVAEYSIRDHFGMIKKIAKKSAIAI